MINDPQLYLGDCLDIMANLPDKSIDMILCDLPYGTTQIEWDKPIPFEPMWRQYERVIVDNGAIVLFSAQPFTTDLIVSNRKLFRYEIIWKKNVPSGFLNAYKIPLRSHENILVFYKKLPTYNPIKSRINKKDIGRKRGQTNPTDAQQYNHYKKDDWQYTETGERFPIDVIEFSNWNGALFGKTANATKHPTQKPVDLCEYLISTYTNPGDTVLDNCFGSGTTAISSIRTGRNFIGMEICQEFYELAQHRIRSELMQPKLMESLVGNHVR